MLIVVDAHSGIPVYRQVMDQIKFHIDTGKLPEGSEIPSTRSLSAELKVNPMTLSKAYSLLEEEGYIERRKGLPSVVAKRSDDDRRGQQIERLRGSLEPAVQLVAELDLGGDEALGVFGAMLADAGSKGESR